MVAVQANTLAQPLTDSSTHFVGADAAYSALHTTANAGQGVIFGDLDTGIWPEHPSFADQGNLRGSAAAGWHAATCNFGDNPLTPAVDPFVCQNKLIGGELPHARLRRRPGQRARPVPGTARDGDGHGTHTTSDVGRQHRRRTPTYSASIAARSTAWRPAPRSSSTRSAAPTGCFDSDSAAAVAQAIVDGVDVINFSISGGTEPFADPVELAFLDAYAAGVFVSSSAGNEGPGAGTANHLSPWVTSVAASTQKREFRSTLSLTAGQRRHVHQPGASITAGAGPAAGRPGGQRAGLQRPAVWHCAGHPRPLRRA